MDTVIHFSKMHGTGNDFIVLDGVSQAIHLTRKLVQRLSHRQLGIGADQILLLEPPAERDADFTYRIFNADGHEVSQCGNGARCIGRFIYDQGLFAGDKVCLQTLAGKLWIHRSADKHITVNMGIPDFNPAHVPTTATPLKQGGYSLPGINTPGYVVSMGNPHCIIASAQVGRAPLQRWAQSLEEAKLFPQGVNLSACETLARNHIKIRTYERGAGETLSCGSAACAAVVCGIARNELNTHVRVDTPGGPLSVEWPDAKGPVYLSGPTAHVYQGTFRLQQTPDPALHY